jgi:hypothetical protein
MANTRPEQITILYKGREYAYSLIFFITVADVWVPGAKTAGLIAKVCFFLKSNYLAVRNFNIQIKYAISDRPHWWQLDLCETSFLLLNGSH